MTDKTLHPQYRPDIDGLRAIAVLSVVLYHGFPRLFQGGFAGVDVFFVISGFLISTILFQNLDHGTFSIVDFYSRRIRRIFPALGLVLFAVLIFGWFCLFPDEYKQLGSHTSASAGFIQNFALWKEAGYFDNASETKPLLHIWSLGIEEQFYFVWPLLLWSAEKLGGNHKRFLYFLATFSTFIISFILNVNLIKLDPTETFYLPQYRFWELALGGILSWMTLYKPKATGVFQDSQASWATSWLTGKRANNALALGGLVILFVSFSQFDKDTVFPGENALLPVFATAFIILAGQDTFINRKVLSHKLLVWFGLISYPLYLWHWPLLSYERIIFGETPTHGLRLLAVAVSILLAWLTVKVIEKPIRFGNQHMGLKVSALCLVVLVVGVLGYWVKNSDGYVGRDKIHIRKNRDGTIGMSERWYRGKSDWLFLGNAYNKTVSKLKLSITPPDADLESTRDLFRGVAETCAPNGTQVVLILGPDKSSIYPEYLPDELTPAPKKYISFFLDRLGNIPNLTVYNPTDDLLAAKTTEGTLYWMTDTHWNNKGSFVAYSGFSTLLGLPVPQVEFTHNGTHPGDLLDFTGIKDFPLHIEDNWDVVWKVPPAWLEKHLPDEPKSSLGEVSIVSNPRPLSPKTIWVVGDSFAAALKQYFNATFKEVRYVGHRLKDLPIEYAKAEMKPDMIVIVRVERSF